MKDPKAFSKSFVSRADSAAFWEAWVGAMLSRHGLYTLHYPFTLIEETGLPKSHYAHAWDLSVTSSIDELLGSPGHKKPIELEVKSVNLKFSFHGDYPHNGVLVCSKPSWDRKWPFEDHTCRDFLLVSRQTGAAVWIPIGCPTGIVEVTDKSRGEKYRCVAVHKSCLRPFDDFVAMVKEQ
jgi:hypothetical protein